MTSGTRSQKMDESRETPPERIHPVGHPLTWVGTAVVLVLLAMLIDALITNPSLQWDVVAQYMFSRDILTGLARTGELTIIAMLIGLALGVGLALMRLSRSPLLSIVSWMYIWFFRSVPVLVQLIFWYNAGAIYSSLSLGIPFGPAFFSANTNQLITPLTAAIAGLGLSQAAYTAEVVRAGITAVPNGQTKAALALGMSSRLTFMRIVLPQAMKLIIPPVGNEVISMIKNTSLVSVIALPELLYSAQLIYSRTYQTIPLLIVASLWYLVVVSILSTGQYFLERRFSRGAV